MAFEQVLFPTDLRDSAFAAVLAKLFMTCSSEIGSKLPLCAPLIPFIDARCLSPIGILGSVLADPNSEGYVRINEQTGKLEIDCQYLR